MAFTITKAVIPVAGLGTRFLPGDQGDAEGDAAGRRQAGHPVRRRGGRRRGPARRAHGHGPQQDGAREPLRPGRRARGGAAQARAISRSSRRCSPPPTSPTSTTCARATRWVSATRCCGPRCTSGGEPFAVLLGDDIIDERDPLLTRMLEVQAQRNTTVVALLEVDPAIAHLYGIATVEPTDEDDVVHITGLVEKPEAGTAPSNLAIIGRYVLRPEIFDVLENTAPGQGRRDPAHRRAAGARDRPRMDRRGVRRRLPRSSLRHRRPPRLPQGDRAARERPRRPRPRVPAWLRTFTENLPRDEHGDSDSE